MDQTVLVGLDIALGEEILKALDAAGLKVNVAMWINLAEFDDWRFLLAARLLDKQQGLGAHRLVDRAIRKAGISIEDTPLIKIDSMTSPFIRDLRRRYAKAGGVSGRRFGTLSVGDKYVNGAYVYRVT